MGENEVGDFPTPELPNYKLCKYSQGQRTVTKIISECTLAQIRVDLPGPTHQLARCHCLSMTILLIAPSQPHSAVEKALVATTLGPKLSFFRRGKLITLAWNQC